MVTVLVVDDERNLLDLVEAYLNTEGFTVVIAMDGPPLSGRPVSFKLISSCLM